VWKTAFDAVQDLISVQDADFNIIMVNRAFAEAFGKKPDELIGLKCYNLIHGTESPPAACPGRATLAGRCSTEDVRGEILGKDLRVMTSPITDKRGKVTAFVHICHDVSDLNKARAALEESEERYKAIVDNMQGGVIIGDGNGKVVFINDKVTEILGFSAQEIASLRRLDFVAPEEKPKIWQKMVEWRISGAKYMETEGWVIRKDKKRLYLHFRVSRLGPEGMSLLLINDLTAMKKSQAKIEKLYTEEKSLRDKLQKEISRRAQYTHTLVHEIKTPLTPVLASSELLAESLTEEPWSSLAKNIYRGASILERRIEDLLDLANIEVGNMKFVPVTLDLRKTVSGVVSMVKSGLEANKQSISVQMPEKQVLVTADDDRLYQVLLNLVNNAAKYSGGGTEIAIEVTTDAKEACVTVSDQGRGMSAETLKHVFEPYFREDHTHPDGLGLGLPLSHHLVQLQGGRMWVESKPGKGTTVGFSLPLAK
jgi:PAS domain S-box-containing protein